MDLIAVSQRDLLHATPEPTVIVDEGGAIIFASARVSDVFGYDPDELIGRPVEVLLPVRFHASHLNHRRAYAGDPNPRPMGSGLELFGRRKDGQEFPVEVSLSPVETDQGRLISSTIRDISERKRTEALLARERAFLDGLIKSAPTMVLVVDPLGRIEQINPYLEQVTGYRAHEVAGRDWITTLLPAEHQEETRALFHRTLREGFNPGHIKALVTRDGSVRHVEWLAKTLVDEHGELTGLLSIGHDVSDKLAHEGALERARGEAERANASKSRFLAAASHDLRQPLQSLGLYLSVLARQLDGGKPLEICEKMRKSLDTMGELLDTLLDISRLDTGSVVPELQDFPLDVVLDRIVTDNAQQAQEKGLELVCSRTGCVVHSDPGLLERVLENFVTNAIRYTHEGRVSIDCDAGDGRVRIAVTDTGVGIPRDALEKVFDEYYQLDNPVRDRRKGLGLGLSIVKHVSRLLELDLKVSSTEGRGSTFSVAVPLGQLEAAATPAEERPRDDEGREPLVLFVEDDASVVDAASMLFEAAGVAMHHAPDGQMACDLLDRGVAYDMLICDYRLPGMNGVEVIRQARSILGREVPVVLMTGDTSSREIEAAALPNCTMLHKPVDTEHLIALIERSVGMTHRRGER